MGRFKDDPYLSAIMEEFCSFGSDSLTKADSKPPIEHDHGRPKLIHDDSHRGKDDQAQNDCDDLGL